MARKSKRMALYEAIQQGQVKIAEGLKTGRLRSDAPESRPSEPDRTPPVDVEMAPARKADYPRSRVKTKKPVSVSPKMAITGVTFTLIVAVFAVGFWLGTGRDENKSTVENQSLTAGSQDSKTESEAKRPGRGIGFWAGSQQEESGQDAEQQKQTADSGHVASQSGANVILIASTNEAIKNELIPVQNFFNEKGIETEIIKGSSGYVFLVTKAGFKDNPQNEGTAGYQLLQRIKQYGLTYPKETGDTQWGRTKAFQDAYGYNKEKN